VLERIVDQERAEIARRPRRLAGRGIRSGHEMSTRREVTQTGQRSLAADKTLAASRDLHRHDLVTEIARVAALEDDAPGLRIDLLVSQRRKRNADLDGPAMVVDPRGRAPEEIG